MEHIGVAHLSDLHFGPTLANWKFGSPPGETPHSLTLCLALWNALLTARACSGLREDDPFFVVVSGDLTVAGSFDEFAVAHAFLRTRLRIRRSAPGNFLGLGRQDDGFAAVPGNHDHWQGSRGWPFMPGGWPFKPAFSPGYVQGSQFRKTPWRKVWRSRSGSLALELFGIDSNSGLAGEPYNALAKGSISDAELEDLRRCLEASRSEEDARTKVVRALVCHHSLSYDGGLAHARPLEPASRDAMLSIAADFRIPAILTGHTHDFNDLDEPTPAYDSHGIPLLVWELRCATTLQGPPAPKRHGFLLHRITLADAVAKWSTWRYEWDGTDFDRKSASPCVEFTVS